jgi:hypothetical protein
MEVVLLVHHHLAMQQCCNARSSSNIFNSSKLFRCRINNISNYLASNSYTFAPTGPTVGAGGLVSGMTIGTSYMFTSGNGSCTSGSSASFSMQQCWQRPQFQQYLQQ